MPTIPNHLAERTGNGWHHLRGKHVKLSVPAEAAPADQLRVLAELSEAATVLTHLTFTLAATLDKETTDV